MQRCAILSLFFALAICRLEDVPCNGTITSDGTGTDWLGFSDCTPWNYGSCWSVLGVKYKLYLDSLWATMNSNSFHFAIKPKVSSPNPTKVGICLDIAWDAGSFGYPDKQLRYGRGSDCLVSDLDYVFLFKKNGSNEQLLESIRDCTGLNSSYQCENGSSYFSPYSGASFGKSDSGNNRMYEFSVPYSKLGLNISQLANLKVFVSAFVQYASGIERLYPGMFTICNDCFTHGEISDCNNNGVIDWCEVAYFQSKDCNMDYVPDVCQANCANIQYQTRI